MVAIFQANNRRLALGVAAAALVLTSAGAAWAQRDPAYAAARASGQVGEKMDGYLGFVSAPSGAVRSLIEDLNIKRRALYSDGGGPARGHGCDEDVLGGCGAFP